jgi:hypothetical protein
MLHHAEPRFLFCLVHIFCLVVCLNLNPKEKIKEKGLENLE